MLRPDYPIKTDRLVLRPFAADDLDALVAYQQLPDVARFLMWPPRDRAQAEASLKYRIEHPTLEKEGDVLVLAVELQDTGALIGDVNLSWMSEWDRTGEFGFVFDPAYHGRGYAREAATEVLRLGFEQMGLHRIIGRADARNDASAALMTRLGLRKEAHFVKNGRVKGEWTDEVVFAMLSEEWPDHRP
ncbi:GNAT family N-acetyltransferase [Actinophytocola oryzae]|uniref:GNAT family N-acetyltransferase n=1 Tax=Actinophytocola oryzae TaxID=502181 RepID=UPI001063A816|nr:GNAT family N-acetyltransferase [Actinophytocola oryzae]